MTFLMVAGKIDYLVIGFCLASYDCATVRALPASDKSRLYSDLSILMRKYPRSVPDDGKFDFLLRIFYFKLNVSILCFYRIQFAFHVLQIFST